MKEKDSFLKTKLLESLKKLPQRENDKFILSILGSPCGVFKTKEDLEKVINFLSETESLAIWPVREWETGEIFCEYVNAKSPDTIIH